MGELSTEQLRAEVHELLSRPMNPRPRTAPSVESATAIKEICDRLSEILNETSDGESR